MDEQILLAEIAVMFQQQNEAVVEYIDKSLDGIRQDIKDSERRIHVLLENDMGKRIDALSDGYMLTHEKQWELQRKLEALEARLALLESRIA